MCEWVCEWVYEGGGVIRWCGCTYQSIPPEVVVVFDGETHVCLRYLLIKGRNKRVSVGEWM